MLRLRAGCRRHPPRGVLTWEPSAAAIRNRDALPAPVLPSAPSICRRVPAAEEQALELRGCAGGLPPARRARRKLAEGRQSEETQESLRRLPPCPLRPRQQS